MADQTTEKPKLGTRPPLGLKRTVETGKVKQSFSHGRSNTVVVEVKKRRFLGRPGEAPPAESPKPVAEAPAPVAPPKAPAPVAPRRPSATDEITRHKELQEKLLREAEEARMSALEGARRREDQAKSSASEEERRRAEENRRAEEAAAEEASRRAQEEALAATAPPAEEEAQVAPSLRDEAEERTFRRPGHAPAPKRPEPARPSRGREDRRHAGKLTVSRALSDEDDSRARSLAALRRARAKEKRHHMEVGPSPQQVR